MKKIAQILYTSLFLVLATSCKDQKLDHLYKEAQAYKNQSKYDQAYLNYIKVFKRKPNTDLALKSAEQAGNLAYLELKKYDQAISLFKYVIINSTEEKIVFKAQKNIARIYFENKREYSEAINSYFNLLKVYPTKRENILWRKKIVKSYYSLNNFFQALSELKLLLREKLNANETYEIKKIEANIYMAIKKPEKAVKIYQGLIKEYPLEKENKSLYVNMAICYEDLAEYQKAVDVLTTAKRFYPGPEFIDVMLKRLDKRIENQPGAKGRLR